MTTIDHLVSEVYANWNDAGRLSRAGQELQDRNRLDHAVAALERAVELDPLDVDAFATLAFAHYRSFASDAGDDALRRGIAATGSDALRAFLVDFGSDDEERERLKGEIEGTEDPVARSLGLSTRFYGGEVGALDEMRALVAAHPDQLDVAESMLWMLVNGARREMLGDLDVREEGFPLADRRIAERPDRIAGYGMRVQLAAAMKDWAGVVEETARALARFPDDESIMQTRARAWSELGQDERAVAWFSRAIGAKPSFAGARVDLGKLYEKQGRFDLAEELFREIPEANPRYPLGPMSLALFLARRERWEEAEEITLECWPRLPEWAQGMLRKQKDAAPLLARDSVAAVIGRE